MGSKDETRSIERCRRLDMYAFRVLVALYAVKVGAYTELIILPRNV